MPVSGSDPTECPCSRQTPAAVPVTNLPTQPSPLHTHRPLHLMRQPSINPPSFYDDVTPPPLTTPPPNYDDLSPGLHGRSEYFESNSNESNTDPDDGHRTGCQGGQEGSELGEESD